MCYKQGSSIVHTLRRLPTTFRYLIQTQMQQRPTSHKHTQRCRNLIPLHNNCFTQILIRSLIAGESSIPIDSTTQMLRNKTRRRATTNVNHLYSRQTRSVNSASNNSSTLCAIANSFSQFDGSNVSPIYVVITLGGSVREAKHVCVFWRVFVVYGCV